MNQCTQKKLPFLHKIHISFAVTLISLITGRGVQHLGWELWYLVDRHVLMMCNFSNDPLPVYGIEEKVHAALQAICISAASEVSLELRTSSSESARLIEAWAGNRVSFPSTAACYFRPAYFLIIELKHTACEFCKAPQFCVALAHPEGFPRFPLTYISSCLPCKVCCNTCIHPSLTRELELWMSPIPMWSGMGMHNQKWAWLDSCKSSTVAAVLPQICRRPHTFGELEGKLWNTHAPCIYS